MKKDDARRLLELLEIYFRETNLSNRDILNKNQVAKLLKTKLTEQGYWKNKNRGK